jgi:tetratricopeptide (TPR) repeat protein
LVQNDDAMVRCFVVSASLLSALSAPSASELPARSASALSARSASQSGRQAYARALELEAAGNDGAAITLLWEAAGLSPRDAEIQNHLGEALERLGALDAAADAYQQAIAARPGFRKATNNLVLVLAKAGRGPDAIQRARALVASAPGDPDALFTLGLALSEQDVTEAITTFQRVLSVAPRHALARYNLALALRRVDRLPEAIAELDRAIAIEARSQPYYQLGVIYLHQGDLTRAANALRDAIRLDDRYADAYSALGAVLTAQSDWAGAASALRQAIVLRPDLFTARYALANVLLRTGDAAGAARARADGDRLRLEAAALQEGGALTAVGIAKLDAGELLPALDMFRRATAACPSCAPAHYQLGRTLQRLGEKEAARTAFARARQLNPALVPPPDYQ